MSQIELSPGAPRASTPARRVQRFPLDVILALLTIYVVWGSTYLGLRLALVSFPPFLLVSTRFLAAGVILFAFLKLRRAALPSRRQWRNAAIVGGCLLAGGVGSTAFAEQYISSSMAAIIVASAPIWNVLAAGLFGDWPKRIEWVGIAIGFLGVALLMSDGNLQAAPIGVMAQSIGLAFWAVGTAVSRHVELPSGGMGNAAEMLMGGAILMVMSVIRGERIVGPIAPQAAVAWVYLVTIGSLLAFSAYMHVVKNVRPAMASSYAYINPVVAIALGALIANEQTTPVALIAVGVIIVGVAFMSLVRGRAS